MIFVENTPNSAGVAIYGDYLDFENLYDALHDVVGDEDDVPVECFAPRLRVLGVCYDLRHALMGDREFAFVDNGMDEEKKKYMEVLAPDKNMYLKIYVLWPEMLFVLLALNHFIDTYAKKQTKLRYDSNLFTEPKLIWHYTIAQVRILQAAVVKCIGQTISKEALARLLNVMNKNHIAMGGYITQYIDLLNNKFINMSREKRLQNISVFAKRIAQGDKEYRQLKADIEKEAKRLNCSVTDLGLNLGFPDYIEW